MFDVGFLLLFCFYQIPAPAPEMTKTKMRKLNRAKFFLEKNEDGEPLRCEKLSLCCLLGVLMAPQLPIFWWVSRMVILRSALCNDARACLSRRADFS